MGKVIKSLPMIYLSTGGGSSIDINEMAYKRYPDPRLTFFQKRQNHANKTIIYGHCCRDRFLFNQRRF